MQRTVYADNAATTKVSKEAIEAMMPIFTEDWGNPSSLHSVGQNAKKILDAAREDIARELGCTANEIYFTSGGSESDNWAIKGAAHAARGRRKIITSKVEHHAVLHTCEALEKEGFEVVYIGVDSDGVVDLEELKRECDVSTALVAIMYANNEIGTIQPIDKIVEIARASGALVFTDAVQAVGSIAVNVKDLGVDMLSLSGHKLGAPKGIGALYVRKGVRIANLIDGGGQERGKRGGTENLPYIVALAAALKAANANLADMDRVKALRDRLIDGIAEKIPYSRLHGTRENRLPGNVNVGFDFIEGESMLLLLNMNGICASTGSACSSNSLEPSHVLLSIGIPHEKAHGSLRLSLSHDNTEEDVDYILEVLPKVVERLRAMSPLYPGK